ncbi:hypothetical protein PISMIDRAFT_565273 [Pisolithus microcarpus 441]|uniref:Uncharacterized protein n=1 Tax=Pisolithus microcarpus 441 TaxID=765257 RepID=A0A0C9YWF1_9AGAM|nr:hypothetical protein PISMIDRAFT_565273 [Pisolithus microcarpus 441]
MARGWTIRYVWRVEQENDLSRSPNMLHNYVLYASTAGGRDSLNLDRLTRGWGDYNYCNHRPRTARPVVSLRLHIYQSHPFLAALHRSFPPFLVAPCSRSGLVILWLSRRFIFTITSVPIPGIYVHRPHSHTVRLYGLCTGFRFAIPSSVCLVFHTEWIVVAVSNCVDTNQ